MEINPLEDTPEEAEFLLQEAWLAAEAQARVTGLSQVQNKSNREGEKEVKVDFSVGVKEGTLGQSTIPFQVSTLMAALDSMDQQINQHLQELNMKEGEIQGGSSDTMSPV